MYLKFPKPFTPATPADVYAAVRELNSEAQKNQEVFFNIPITSSGARRLIPKEEKPDRNRIIEIALKNLDIAREVIGVTALYLPEETVIGSSTDFGLYEGWGETEYMRYWFYHISGITIADAHRFEAHLHAVETLDKATLNDYSKTNNDREAHYEQIITEYCRFLKNENIATDPISRMIAIPDSISSLGCRAEMRLAMHLGIDLTMVTFDSDHVDFNNLKSKTIWDEIAQMDNTFILPTLQKGGSHMIHLTEIPEGALTPICL